MPRQISSYHPTGYEKETNHSHQVHALIEIKFCSRRQAVHGREKIIVYFIRDAVIIVDYFCTYIDL